MKNSISKIALIALATISATNQAIADDQFYVGVSASQAFVDERGLDDDDTGGKIFGGYKLNEYFSIEAAYYDFGEIEDNGSNFEVDGPSLAVIGSLPLTKNFSILAKAGVHDWAVESSSLISAQLSEDSDSDAFYGVGVDYSLTDKWTIRGEVERYEIEDIDLDVASVGVSFNF